MHMHASTKWAIAFQPRFRHYALPEGDFGDGPLNAFLMRNPLVRCAKNVISDRQQSCFVFLLNLYTRTVLILCVKCSSVL